MKGRLSNKEEITVNTRYHSIALRLALVFGVAAAFALGGLAPAHADSTHTTTLISIPIEEFFPGGIFHDPSGCLGGEDIQFSGGSDDIVIQSVTDGQGNLHYHFHDNLRQGVTGVGLTSGNTYIFTGAPFDADYDPYGPPPVEFTMTNHFTIIGTGQAGNVVVTLVIFVHINANGDVTATHNVTSIVCH